MLMLYKILFILRFNLRSAFTGWGYLLMKLIAALKWDFMMCRAGKFLIFLVVFRDLRKLRIHLEREMPRGIIKMNRKKIKRLFD